MLATVLRSVESDGSGISSAMELATTKPVIGTVEIATKNTVKKKAPNPNAYSKNPSHAKNFGKMMTVLLDVHGSVSEILGAKLHVTAKPVIGTVEIATKNTVSLEKVTLASVLLDVKTA